MLAQLLKKIASFDITLTAIVCGVIGVLILSFGFLQEVHGQSDLYRLGGEIAVDAYNNAMQQYAVNSVTAYVALAFFGELPSFGGNAQAIGFTISMGGPVIVAAGIWFSRRIIRLDDRVSFDSTSSRPC